jgi:hypothetical protein
MSWLDRATQILENGLGVEPTKPPKGQEPAKNGLLSVLSVGGPALSEKKESQEAANDEVIDPAVEGRRQRLLAMLDNRKDKSYAVIVDAESDPDDVIVAVAKRGKAICELRFPKGRYDPFLLMDLADRYCGTEH